MKLIATLVLSLGICGLASAAPITSSDEFAPEMSGETAGQARNGTELCRNNGGSNGGGSGGGESPIPEPATMALLGLGLGCAALRRRK